LYPKKAIGAQPVFQPRSSILTVTGAMAAGKAQPMKQSYLTAPMKAVPF
jgi:Ni,Fe-hydrogenase III small subunit